MIVFISYRRGDARHVAGRLRDHIGWERGVAEVFLDTQSIRPGEQFPERLRAALGRADCVLVVIGPKWDGGTPQAAMSTRIFDQDDCVRMEVALALSSGADVIPVLVDGAAMPGPGQVPPELRPLLQRNAYTIANDRGFAEEVRPLLRHILGREPGGVDTPGRIAAKAALGAVLGLVAFLLFSALTQFGLGLDAQRLFPFTDRESAQALWELLPVGAAAAGAVAVAWLGRRWRITLPR